MSIIMTYMPPDLGLVYQNSLGGVHHHQHQHQQQQHVVDQHNHPHQQPTNHHHSYPQQQPHTIQPLHPAPAWPGSQDYTFVDVYAAGQMPLLDPPALGFGYNTLPPTTTTPLGYEPVAQVPQQELHVAEPQLMPQLEMVVGVNGFGYPPSIATTTTAVQAPVAAVMGYCDNSGFVVPNVEDMEMRRSETAESETATSSKTVSPVISPQPVQTATHRRRKFDREERRKTHMTRLQGACIECWRIKKRCVAVPNGCCETCLHLLSSLPPYPCYRSRVTSSELFRRGPTSSFLTTPRGVRWLKTSPTDPKVWRSSSRVITISQGDNPVSATHPLQLTIKLYHPQPGDQLSYTWTNSLTGELERLELPPYAIADIDAAEESVKRYINDHLSAHIAARVPGHTLSRLIFDRALSLSTSSPLLKSTLRLFAASRIIEAPWHISASSPATFTPPPPAAPRGSPYENITPVTPIIDYQLDAVTIHRVLLPLRKALLGALQKKVLESRADEHGEVFLCVYVLLRSIEGALRHDAAFARRMRGGREGERGVDGDHGKWSNKELVERMVEGANVLLLHWHKATRGVKGVEERRRRGERAEREFWERVAAGDGVEGVGAAMNGEGMKRGKGNMKGRKGGMGMEEEGFWTRQMWVKSEEWKPIMGLF
ncbi:hypothetical protein EX30DRAFT_399137 [Ascodesmis nigricans]|uniref:Zn(2)-C6 fungal-type domain-containing protein n=1 Tax=Ascodesmis nigricans TaxID=341454 RepID=A0A4S2MIB4_9PEZI|nr:hypothetical protein EX30DRAFT_399137 [Ascodesmis nigricans]